MGSKKKNKSRSTFSKDGMGFEESRKAVRGAITSKTESKKSPNMRIREEIRDILHEAKEKKERAKAKISQVAKKGISDLKLDWNRLTAMMSGMKVKEGPEKKERPLSSPLAESKKPPIVESQNSILPKILDPNLEKTKLKAVSYYQKWYDLVISEKESQQI